MSQNHGESPCRLLALPRELRDHIYEYTFSSTEVTVKSGHPIKPKEEKPTNHGLVLVSKQLYHETLDLYYTHSKFSDYSEGALVKWLASKTPRIQDLLKHVKLYVAIPIYPCCLEGWDGYMISFARQDFAEALDRAGVVGMIQKVEFEIVRQAVSEEEDEAFAIPRLL